MIGFYNYTVILTYLGTVSGFVGLTFAFDGNPLAALICLIFAGLCDMFDGKVASTKKRTQKEKRFGIQIDSLSDVICFGVLPAAIVYQTAGGQLWAIPVCAFYMLCALIRLAFYNVDEEDRQEEEGDEARKVYLGLPVTSSALLIPLFMGLGALLNIHNWINLPMNILSACFLGLVAIAFITPFHLKKPGRVGKLLMLVFGTIILAIVVYALMGVLKK